MFTPTLSQAATLDPHRNWIVTAGAGAGKTSILTQRYLYLLEQDTSLKLSQILALTFTQKAAEEMKTRVYKGILQSSSLGRVDLDRLFEWKEEFSNNQISTIHSFCYSLLMIYPIEAGIDSTYSLCSEPQQRKMIQKAYQKVLYSYIDKSPIQGGGHSKQVEKNNTILKILDIAEEYEMRNSFLYEFMFHPQRFLSLSQSMGYVLEQSQEYFEWLKEFGVSRALKVLEEEDVGLKIENSLEKYEDDSTYVAILKDWHEAIILLHRRDFSCVSKMKGHLETLKELTRKSYRKKDTISPIRILSILDEVQWFELDGHLDQDSLQYLGPILEFFSAVRNEYLSLCRQSQVLDFNELQVKVRDILLQNIELRTEIQNRYQYILVDEFQDTDPVQWEILDLLNQKKDQPAHKMFIVGDEKQAIYGFRGGDVQIFRKASGLLESRNPEEKPLAIEHEGHPFYSLFQASNSIDLSKSRRGKIDFSENFRSKKNILVFLNQFFEKVFDPKTGFDPNPQNLIPMRSMGESADEGIVTILVGDFESTSSPEEEDLSVYEKEAAMIGKYLKDEVLSKSNGNASDHQVGILFRKFTHIKYYEETFRMLGLDFFVHRGKGFFRRPEILDLYNLLEFLNDPRKDISLLGVLRSPIFALTDEEIFQYLQNRERSTIYYHLKDQENPSLKKILDTLDRWLLLKDRLRINELLRTIIKESQMNVVWGMGIRGKQTIQNVEKFIDLARSFESEGLQGLPQFCMQIRSFIEEDQDEGEAVLDVSQTSGIVFMTIHQSKGLEFPVVVLPDLNSRMLKHKIHYLESAVFPDGKERFMLGLKCPDRDQDSLKKSTLCRTLLADQSKMKQYSEEKRLFYVGATRARDHLILAGSFKESLYKKMQKGVSCLDSALSSWDWVQEVCRIEPGKAVTSVEEEGPEVSIQWFGESNLSSPVIPPSEIPQRLSDQFRSSAQSRPKEELPMQRDVMDLAVQETLVLSPTSLGIFKKCPRKFYFQSIMKIPPFLSLSPQSKAESSGWNQEMAKQSATIRGKVIHRMAEKPTQVSPEWISTLVDYEMDQEESSSSIRPYRDRIVASVQKHWTSMQSEKEWFSRILKDKEFVFHEVPFEVDMGLFRMTGILDTLIQNEDSKTWSILDFKTNSLGNAKSSPDIESQIRDMSDSEKYDLQINCYAFAAESILGENSIQDLFLWFTAPNGIVYKVPKDFSMVEKAMDELEKFLQDAPACLEQVEQYLPQSPAECQGCSFHRLKLCDLPEKVS